MTAVQDYVVHCAAKLTRVCHYLTAHVLSSCTCFEPYESITHTHTHTRARARHISRRSPEYYLPVCVKIFLISNYSPILELSVFFYLGIIKTLLFRSQLCFGPHMVTCRVDSLGRAPVNRWTQQSVQLSNICRKPDLVCGHMSWPIELTEVPSEWE